MTAVATLIERVRSNINEPLTNDDPQRSDQEIADWLQEAQIDYISKVPADAFPEIIEEVFQSGGAWTVALDYIKLLQVLVNHNVPIGGSTVETAYVLPIDGEYLAQRWPSGLGAWAKFHENAIRYGPQAISSTITYQRQPRALGDICVESELDDEHDGAIVLYATAMALNKLNDEDADKYMSAYTTRVEAEQSKHGKESDVERVP